MDYEKICKYVFEQQGVSWESCASKKRDRDLVAARQISIYIGNWFNPSATWTSLSAPFNKDHATAMHSVKNIRNLMFSDRSLREKIIKYIDHIQEEVRKEQIAEIETAKLLQNEKGIQELLKVIDKMELVAQIYCEITGSKIVKPINH